MEKKGKNKDIKKLIVISMLGAVAFVLMLFEFPLPFAPSFYEMDFSEVAVLVGAFAYGPVAGLVIEAIKIVLNLAYTGSVTMGVGELANYLIGISLVVPAAVIYMRHKTRKHAIIGLAVGVLTMVVVGGLLNAFLLLPAYAYFLSSPEFILTVDTFVEMGAAVNPWVNNLFTFIVFAVVPFNLIKGIATSVIVVLIYKRISMLIKANDSH